MKRHLKRVNSLLLKRLLRTKGNLIKEREEDRGTKEKHIIYYMHIKTVEISVHYTKNLQTDYHVI